MVDPWTAKNRDRKNAYMRAYNKKRRAAARAQPIECAECHSDFVRPRLGTKYCSPLCQQRYNRKRDMPRALRWQRKAYYKARQVIPWRHVYDGIKRRCKVKNKLFSLTREWVKARYTGHCELTGMPFIIGDRRHPYSFSIDQIAPDKGYTADNVRFVLWCINSFKTDGTDAQMYRAAEALLAHKNIIPPLQGIGGILSLPE